MENKTFKILLLAIGAAIVMGVSISRAATFTATTTGNWSAGATWGNSGNNVVGSGVPGAADDAVIPSGIIVSAAAAGTAVNNLTVNNSGTLNINANSGSAILTINGNVTNNGTWSLGASAGNSTAVTYAGSGGVITGAGTIANQIATFTGSYTLQAGASFSVGNKNGGINHLLGGAGSLVNQGTIIYNSGDQGSSILNNPDITSLDCSAVGNTFILKWSNVASGHNAVRAITYCNFVYNSNNGTGCDLSGSGLGITGNVTFDIALSSGGGSASAWLINNTIGGSIIYKTSATAAAFPATLSIGGLNQSAGTLTLPANAVLTVTGTGAGTWTRSAGTFTANATSTVIFTGTAPDIGGSVVTTFRNLIIDSTATTATASGSGFAVNTALIINPSGQLDISALSGSSLTLGASASLTNGGAIKGGIVTGATGKVFAGTDSGYGTSTIALTPSTGDLTMTSGSTVNIDVNSTAVGANDKLVVGGTLTLNSTVFNLKAPSNGATIDTANDYTLATASAISGTPVLNWVTGFVPANSGNYVLVVSGGTITLHNTGGGPVGSPTLSLLNSGDHMTLSWDSSTFPGFTVQVLTNNASVGLGSNWVDLGGGPPYNISIDPANPSVFFRLTHP